MAGDIIFFDWGDNGTIDHVGIVERSVEPSNHRRNSGIKWQDELRIGSTIMDRCPAKRQEKKCDSLMVNLEYTIPENRLDFQILQA